jgi:hypothetical protein
MVIARYWLQHPPERTLKKEISRLPYMMDYQIPSDFNNTYYFTRHCHYKKSVYFLYYSS